MKSVYTNRKNGVCIYTSQNAKIPTVDPPVRRGKTVRILGVAFIDRGIFMHQIVQTPQATRPGVFALNRKR